MSDYDSYHDWMVVNENPELAQVRRVPRMDNSGTLTLKELVDTCVEIHERAYNEDDWAECNTEIRCIWADQLMTRLETLTGKKYLHRFGWYAGCMIYQASFCPHVV